MTSEQNLQSTVSDKDKSVTICSDNKTKISKKSSKAIMVSSLIKNSEVDSLATQSAIERLKSKNSQVPVISSTANATNTANKNSQPNGSSKMGSRRIFTPQFKLQVLESYRSDSDCKGNQRATARKYNIHRRQIQKWLQCESNLRSSVANINQNNIEHQFHNINHLQHLQHHQQLQMTTASNVASNHYNHSHIFHHQPAHAEQLPLPSDTTGQSADYGTALSPVTTSSSTMAAKGMLAAANFTNMVMTTADSVPLSNPLRPTMTFAMSPLRPSTIGRNDSTNSPYLYQHQHYPIPYSGSSTIASVSVPILADYASPQHQYQSSSNCSHTTSLVLQQPSTVLSTSLPGTALSFAAAEVVSRREVQNDRNKRCYQACTVKSLPINEYSNKNYFFSKNNPNGSNRFSEELYESDGQNKSLQQNVSVTPMDLSVGSRRKHDLLSHPPPQHSIGTKKENKVVDLTFRKRKFITNVEVNLKAPKLEQSGHDEIQDNLPACTDESVKLQMAEFEGNEEETSDEVEIDVVERTPPPKPVKLFKPYLLDQEDNLEEKPSSTQIYENGQVPAVWSHHSAGASPNRCEENHPDIYANRAFHSAPLERREFPVRNTTYMSRADSTPCPQPVPEFSGRGFPCPKGSPVSGYESSSSIYSDSSSSGADSVENAFMNNRSYSIDLKLQPISNENVLTNKSHIQKWLDRDIIKTATTVANASNVLYI